MSQILAETQTIQLVRHGNFDNDDLDAVSIDSRSLQNGFKHFFSCWRSASHDYIHD
jgi:hypothetical protein